jgi:Icc-related predicted phosphoesterase
VSTFLFASDLHGNARAYDELFAMEADAIVLGGDLLPHPRGWGERLIDIQVEFARGFLAKKLRSRPCFWLLGNDDWEACLPLLEGAGTYLHGRAVPFLDGLSIAGYACVPVTPFGMKDFDRFDGPGWTPPSAPAQCLMSGPGGLRRVPLEAVRARGTIEEDLERLAALSDPGRTIYVTHSPPHGTRLDLLLDGTPVGSPAVRAFLERRQPPLSLHGHIHESPGVDRLGRTVSVNPGDSLGRLRAVRVTLPGPLVEPLAGR